ncbi:MAG: peptidylprolyl isomerase, partial [Thermoplasmata archaeon]|nr:peptidylprolyl isomerase [Thermoplasmata archaeon]
MTTVALQTTMGDVKIELFEDTMPVTAGNFRKLVDKR